MMVSPTMTQSSLDLLNDAGLPPQEERSSSSSSSSSSPRGKSRRRPYLSSSAASLHSLPLILERDDDDHHHHHHHRSHYHHDETSSTGILLSTAASVVSAATAPAMTHHHHHALQVSFVRMEEDDKQQQQQQQQHQYHPLVWKPHDQQQQQDQQSWATGRNQPLNQQLQDRRVGESVATTADTTTPSFAVVYDLPSASPVLMSGRETRLTHNNVIINNSNSNSNSPNNINNNNNNNSNNGSSPSPSSDSPLGAGTGAGTGFGGGGGASSASKTSLSVLSMQTQPLLLYCDQHDPVTTLRMERFLALHCIAVIKRDCTIHPELYQDLLQRLGGIKHVTLPGVLLPVTNTGKKHQAAIVSDQSLASHSTSGTFKAGNVQWIGASATNFQEAILQHVFDRWLLTSAFGGGPTMPPPPGAVGSAVKSKPAREERHAATAASGQDVQWMLPDEHPPASASVDDLYLDALFGNNRSVGISSRGPRHTNDALLLQQQQQESREAITLGHLDPSAMDSHNTTVRHAVGDINYQPDPALLGDVSAGAVSQEQPHHQGSQQSHGSAMMIDLQVQNPHDTCLLSTPNEMFRPDGERLSSARSGVRNAKASISRQSSARSSFKSTSFKCSPSHSTDAQLSHLASSQVPPMCNSRQTQLITNCFPPILLPNGGTSMTVDEMTRLLMRKTPHQRLPGTTNHWDGSARWYFKGRDGFTLWSALFLDAATASGSSHKKPDPTKLRSFVDSLLRRGLLHNLTPERTNWLDAHYCLQPLRDPRALNTFVQWPLGSYHKNGNGTAGANKSSSSVPSLTATRTSTAGSVSASGLGGSVGGTSTTGTSTTFDEDPMDVMLRLSRLMDEVCHEERPEQQHSLFGQLEMAVCQLQRIPLPVDPAENAAFAVNLFNLVMRHAMLKTTLHGNTGNNSNRRTPYLTSSSTSATTEAHSWRWPASLHELHPFMSKVGYIVDGDFYSLSTLQATLFGRNQNTNGTVSAIPAPPQLVLSYKRPWWQRWIQSCRDISAVSDPTLSSNSAAAAAATMHFAPNTIRTDLRILFATTWGTRSSPTVMTLYPNRLDEGLHAAAEMYCQQHVVIGTHQVLLPAMCLWYRKDLGVGAVEVLDTLKPFLSHTQLHQLDVMEQQMGCLHVVFDTYHDWTPGLPPLWQQQCQQQQQYPQPMLLSLYNATKDRDVNNDDDRKQQQSWGNELMTGMACPRPSRNLMNKLCMGQRSSDDDDGGGGGGVDNTVAGSGTQCHCEQCALFHHGSNSSDRAGVSNWCQTVAAGGNNNNNKRRSRKGKSKGGTQCLDSTVEDIEDEGDDDGAGTGEDDNDDEEGATSDDRSLFFMSDMSDITLGSEFDAKSKMRSMASSSSRSLG